jgi:hypothetical protein
MRAFAVQLVNQVKVKKWDYLKYAGIILGAYIFGMIMFQVIMVLAADEGDGTFYMGSMMSVMMLVLLMVFLMSITQVAFFNYSISMGRIRKYYWPALALESFLLYVLLELEILLLEPVEGRILALTWPGRDPEGPSGILGWSLVLPMALAGVGCTLLCTAVMIKFGRAAYFAWYILFVAACVGVPRLIESVDLESHPVFAQIVDAIALHWQLAFLLGGAAIAVICYAASYLMIRRQQVNI